MYHFSTSGNMKIPHDLSENNELESLLVLEKVVHEFPLVLDILERLAKYVRHTTLAPQPEDMPMLLILGILLGRKENDRA